VLWKTLGREAQMHGSRRLNETEVADPHCRRPGARASLACETLHVTAAEEALFEQSDHERLTMEEREARLIAWTRARREPSGAHAAE
jgi:hypothetical protein